MSTMGEGHGNRLQAVVASEGRELEAVFSRIEAETTGQDERRRIQEDPNSLVSRLLHTPPRLSGTKPSLAARDNLQGRT